MKKTILIFTSILLFGSLSCSKSKKNDPMECSGTITTEYEAAIKAWSADLENKTKCQAVVTVLGKLINCPGVTNDAKAEYEKLLKENPCNNL